MSDKKITALSERLVPIIGEDLLVLVANTVPANQAANYKVQVKNFLSNTQIQLPNTATSAFRLTANVVVNSTAVLAAGEFRLDAGNNSIGGTKAYGLLVNHTIANSSYARCQSPVAFLGVEETVGANASFATTYLLDVGLAGTANVSANSTAPNSSVVLTVANDTPSTHMVKCSFNGQTLWLLAANTAPA